MPMRGTDGKDSPRPHVLQITAMKVPNGHQVANNARRLLGCLADPDRKAVERRYDLHLIRVWRFVQAAKQLGC